MYSSSVLDAWPSWLPFLGICFVLGFGTNLKHPAAPAGLTSSCKYTMSVCLVFLLKIHPKIQKKGSTSVIFSLFIGMQLMDEVIFFLCVCLCALMGKLLHFKPGFQFVMGYGRFYMDPSSALLTFPPHAENNVGKSIRGGRRIFQSSSGVVFICLINFLRLKRVHSALGQPHY